MSVTAKILIFVAVIAILGGMGLIIYNQNNIAKQQQAIQEQVIQQKTLIDGLVQSSNQYTTKDDLNKFIQQNTNDLKAIQDNLASLGATITAANVVTANSQGQVASNIPSTGTKPSGNKPTPVEVPCPNGGTVTCPTSDPYGYQTNQQTLTLNEDFTNLKVPFGDVSFSAWLQKPWSIDIKPRQYNVISVIGTDENQRIYVDNKFTVEVADKTYVLPITTAKTEQVYPTAKFNFWNPRLLLGVDGGVNLTHVQGEFSPNVSLGIMSYGQYKTTPDWSVLEVGAAYQSVNKKPAVVITPLAYNVGKKLFSPLMNNTYVAPSIMLGVDGSWTVGAGLRVGF
jgi:hypothetical protein